MTPIELQNLIEKVHEATDLSSYVNVLFSDRNIGNIDFGKLASFCFNHTQTDIPSWKMIRRVERLFNLLKFNHYALSTTKGDIAECGVYRGCSALALGLQSQLSTSNQNPNREIFLIDSFEGLSEPTDEDLVEEIMDGKPVKNQRMKRGFFSTSLDDVKANLSEIRGAQFRKGWIPDVFQTIEEKTWSFVHIDVDLYGPVKNCLEYFYPRLEQGGVIINDDFASPNFPGAGRAWTEFFDSLGTGYAILDTGQAVFLKT